MARRLSLEQAVISTFQDKFAHMRGRGVSFSLDDIGIETFEEILAGEPADALRFAGTVRAQLDAAGHDTDDAKLKYLMEFAADHQTDICRLSADKNADFGVGDTDKDGNLVLIDKDKLMASFGEKRKIDIPEASLEELIEDDSKDAENEAVPKPDGDQPAEEAGHDDAENKLTLEQAINDRFRAKFRSIKEKNGDFTLDQIGIQTFHEILTDDPRNVALPHPGAVPKMLEDLGHKEDRDKLKYLMAYVAEHQEDICRESDDKGAGFIIGEVDDDGKLKQIERVALLGSFWKKRELDVPAGTGPENTGGTGSHPQGNAQNQGTGSDGDGKKEKAESQYEQQRRRFDQMLEDGLITEEECRQAKILTNLVETMNAANPALKSLYNTSSYMSSTTMSSVRTYFTAKRFEKFQRQHMKLSQDIGHSYDVMMADFNARNGMTPGQASGTVPGGRSGHGGKGGFLGGMLGRIGRRKETPDAEIPAGDDTRESKQGRFAKAGGTIVKAGGAVVAVGAAIGKGLFKNIHPLMWVKNTYQDIADNVKEAIKQNKDPANKKDKSMLEKMFASMTREDFTESRQLSPEFIKMIQANRALFEYALKQTMPEDEHAAPSPEAGTGKDAEGKSGKDTGDKPAKEADEKAAKEQAAKDAAEKAAKEQAAKEAAEKAAREQAAKEAAEKAAREQAAKEAAEKAAKEQATKEAAEKAAREQAAKEAAEKAAKEQAAKEAAEKAAREQAVKDAAEKDAKKTAEPADGESVPDRELGADAMEIPDDEDDPIADLNSSLPTEDELEEEDGDEADKPAAQDAATRTMEAQARADEAVLHKTEPVSKLDEMRAANRATDARAAAQQAVLEEDDEHSAP